MKKIRAKCDECQGTGLYSGMCEGPGVAVVCLGCDGTGCKTIEYTPFKRRVAAKGINTVMLSRGKHILTGVGNVDKMFVAYNEFRKGKLRSLNSR